jgi:hypothetical protein
MFDSFSNSPVLYGNETAETTANARMPATAGTPTIARTGARAGTPKKVQTTGTEAVNQQ